MAKKQPTVKPMRGEKADLPKLRYPLLAFPKIDGLRGMVGEHLFSKTMKLIPNRYTQDLLSDLSCFGQDGELTPGYTVGPNLMQESMSAFMSRDGEPNVLFTVFDLWDMPDATYRERYMELQKRVRKLPTHLKNHIQICEFRKIENEEQLLAYEQEVLSRGYEGLMLRAIDGKYKYGKSTVKEQYLLKLKRWEDGEFVIEDIELQMKNENEKEEDEMGYSKRSTKKDGLVQQNLVGALLGTDIQSGQPVRAGSGLSAKQRKDFFDQWNDGTLKGQIVHYKHFNVTGVKEARRFAIFKSIRHPDDISED